MTWNVSTDELDEFYHVFSSKLAMDEYIEDRLAMDGDFPNGFLFLIQDENEANYYWDKDHKPSAAAVKLANPIRIFDDSATLNSYVEKNSEDLEAGQIFLLKDNSTYWWDGSALRLLMGGVAAVSNATLINPKIEGCEADPELYALPTLKLWFRLKNNKWQREVQFWTNSGLWLQDGSRRFDKMISARVFDDTVSVEESLSEITITANKTGVSTVFTDCCDEFTEKIVAGSTYKVLLKISDSNGEMIVKSLQSYTFPSDGAQGGPNFYNTQWTLYPYIEANECKILLPTESGKFALEGAVFSVSSIINNLKKLIPSSTTFTLNEDKAAATDGDTTKYGIVKVLEPSETPNLLSQLIHQIGDTTLENISDALGLEEDLDTLAAQAYTSYSVVEKRIPLGDQCLIDRNSVQPLINKILRNCVVGNNYLCDANQKHYIFPQITQNNINEYTLATIDYPQTMSSKTMDEDTIYHAGTMITDDNYNYIRHLVCNGDGTKRAKVMVPIAAGNNPDVYLLSTDGNQYMSNKTIVSCELSNCRLASSTQTQAQTNSVNRNLASLKSGTVSLMGTDDGGSSVIDDVIDEVEEVIETNGGELISNTGGTITFPTEGKLATKDDLQNATDPLAKAEQVSQIATDVLTNASNIASLVASINTLMNDVAEVSGGIIAGTTTGTITAGIGTIFGAILNHSTSGVSENAVNKAIKNALKPYAEVSYVEDTYATKSSLSAYATKTGTETLTNKTLINPTIGQANQSVLSNYALPTIKLWLRYSDSQWQWNIQYWTNTSQWEQSGNILFNTVKYVRFNNSVVQELNASLSSGISGNAIGWHNCSSDVQNLLQLSTSYTMTLEVRNSSDASVAIHTEQYTTSSDGSQAGPNFWAADWNITPLITVGAHQIIMPSSAGTLALVEDIATATNTLATKSEVSSAIAPLANSLSAYATKTGSETLTNKTITNPILSPVSSSSLTDWAFPSIKVYFRINSGKWQIDIQYWTNTTAWTTSSTQFSYIEYVKVSDGNTVISEPVEKSFNVNASGSNIWFFNCSDTFQNTIQTETPYTIEVKVRTSDNTYFAIGTASYTFPTDGAMNGPTIMNSEWMVQPLLTVEENIIKLPTSSGTLATTDGTETFSNKNIDSSNKISDGSLLSASGYTLTFPDKTSTLATTDDLKDIDPSGKMTTYDIFRACPYFRFRFNSETSTWQYQMTFSKYPSSDTNYFHCYNIFQYVQFLDCTDSEKVRLDLYGEPEYERVNYTLPKTDGTVEMITTEWTDFTSAYLKATCELNKEYKVQYRIKEDIRVSYQSTSTADSDDVITWTMPSAPDTASAWYKISETKYANSTLDLMILKYNDLTTVTFAIPDKAKYGWTVQLTTEEKLQEKYDELNTRLLAIENMLGISSSGS